MDQSEEQKSSDEGARECELGEERRERGFRKWWGRAGGVAEEAGGGRGELGGADLMKNCTEHLAQF